MKIFGTGWQDLQRLVTITRRKRWITKTLDSVAVKTKKDIIRNIQSGGSYAGQPFLPNASLTVYLKGSSRPWINTGKHLRGVEIAKSSTERAVGWDGETGEIAEIVEFGAAVPVTPQMRKDFITEGFVLRDSTQNIIIPGRPNLTALAQKYKSTGELLAVAKSVIGREFNVKV